MPSPRQSLRKYAEEQRKPAKKKLVGTLFLAVVLQIAVIALTVFVVVFVPTTREDPQFVSQKTIYLPQRELQHQMAVSEFQQAAPSPMMMDKVQVDQMTPTNMPNLPEMPRMEFTPIAPDQSSPFGAALFANAGIGGMMEGLVGDASTISFLGVHEEASRFVIVMDVSGSVVNSVEASGMSMDMIREEAKDLIRSLNANTLFGFVQHVRGFDTFTDYLIPATVENKNKAIEWLDRRFRTSGRSGQDWRRGPEGSDGIVPIMDFIFDMDPEVIILISDGGYHETVGRGQRPVTLRELTSLIRNRQKDLSQEARIHTIHFPDIRNIQDGRIGPDLRRISASNDGQYRQMELK